MQSRRLGRSGLVVSQTGLGCMGMPEFCGAGDDAESMAVIGRVLELGITFLDTGSSRRACAPSRSRQCSSPMTIDPTPPAVQDPFFPLDGAALSAELASLRPERFDGRREAVVAVLKRVLNEGRELARRLFDGDGHGRTCAERLSRLTDEIVRATFEHAQDVLFPRHNPSLGEQLCIVAVGGYGRGTLAPGSDVDVLFLRPYKQTPWGESIVETVLYTLWDLGLKVGHATRSVDECIRLAQSDMTIRTAVLEARPLAGDGQLMAELMDRFWSEIAAHSVAEFVSAKLAERDTRVRKAGTSRYLVEPNVKDGKGGLRDLNTLFWIARYVYRAKRDADFVSTGLFRREELELFERCEDFLWAVRCHLHFLTDRSEERLSFDLQRPIAEKLGYTHGPGMRDVEMFMKDYFTVAKDVGDLTAIVCAALEEKQAKPRPSLDRFSKPIRKQGRRELEDHPEFTVEHHRLNVRDDRVFEDSPLDLIRLFHIAAMQGLAIHPDARRLVTLSLNLIDDRLREDREANRLFLDILTSRNAPAAVLRQMNEAGLLGRFIPDFGRIVSMMQFNMYHHYTVDEHLIRTIGILAEIDRGVMAEEHPLAVEIMPTIGQRRVLYVAVLLHDIAKGRPEDHSEAGAAVAAALCPRLGLSPLETETVIWLVRHHLDMSIVAQSRDLADRKTIADFATTVQSLERLKMLLILTICDIKAVGPGVWNNWKAQLLRTLYWETELSLAGGQSTANRSQRVRAAQEELGRSLFGWNGEEIDAYLSRHYPAYWLRVDLPRKLQHAHFIREAEACGRSMATRFATDVFSGATELTVLAADHPRLLSVMAGACAAAGASIVDAHIHTTTDGLALDTIFVRRGFDDDADEIRRGERIAGAIERTLRGELRLPEIVARRVPGARSRAFEVEPGVHISDNWSDRYTAIEVSGFDRPGLLYELTTAISDLNLNIASAHVATFGERAVDVFYVTDLTGAKIGNTHRRGAIRNRLLAVFGVTAHEPPRDARPIAAT